MSSSRPEVGNNAWSVVRIPRVDEQACFFTSNTLHGNNQLAVRLAGRWSLRAVNPQQHIHPRAVSILCPIIHGETLGEGLSTGLVRKPSVKFARFGELRAPLEKVYVSSEGIPFQAQAPRRRHLLDEVGPCPRPPLSPLIAGTAASIGSAEWPSRRGPYCFIQAAQPT